MRDKLREWFRQHVAEYGGVSDIKMVLCSEDVMLELEADATTITHIVEDIIDPQGQSHLAPNPPKLCNGVPIETCIALSEESILIIGTNGRPIATITL